MGNCLRRNSAAMVCDDGDDHWVYISQLHDSKTTTTQHINNSNNNNPEIKQRLLCEFIRSSSILSTSSSGGDQVKITVTKKELEELVEGGGNVQGLSTVEQLLTRLMINGRDYHDHDPFYDDHDQMEDHERHWRPVLQTIPEVN